MSLFDTNVLVKLMNKIVDAIDDLGTNQANAIIDGFERAAHIIADKLQEIEDKKNNEDVYNPPP